MYLNLKLQYINVREVAGARWPYRKEPENQGLKEDANMFINLHGPPTRDPAIRAAVNLHLSKVSKNKRTRYNVEKLDRRQAQQRRRRREIEEQRVRDETEQRALVSWTVNQSIRNSMSGDLLTPEQHLNENTTGWKAARDCECSPAQLSATDLNSLYRLHSV